MITNKEILEALEASKQHWIKDNINITEEEFVTTDCEELNIFNDTCALCNMFYAYVNCMDDGTFCPLNSNPCSNLI